MNYQVAAKKVKPRKPNIQSIAVLEDRILSATRRSQISIFKVKGANRYLESYFANIVYTIARLRDGCSHHIGTYYGVEGAEQFKIDTAKFA